MIKLRSSIRSLVALAVASSVLTHPTPARATSAEVDAVYPSAHALYVDLHQHPELSGSETQTAAKLASQLRALGYTVTEHVGGTGVVALLKNGPGPTIMLRTELDALPVEEKTGLAFASKVHTKDAAGHEVSVGHMCGHDLHMSALVATAGIMARSRSDWHGTLMLVGQPAEETISGASAMVRDGLFKRFPRPDVAARPARRQRAAGGQGGRGPRHFRYQRRLAADHDLRQGRPRLGTAHHRRSGRDRGPHHPGAADHHLARGQAGGDGGRHGGLRQRRHQEQHHSGSGGTRAHRAHATSRRCASRCWRRSPASPMPRRRRPAPPRPPPSSATRRRMRSTTTRRLPSGCAPCSRPGLGKDNVLTMEPITASEDFSAFVAQGIRGFYLAWAGRIPQKYAAARASGAQLPSNHSSLFAPDVEPALRTAIAAEVALLRDLLKPGATG